MNLLLAASSNSALITFSIYTLAVFGLAAMSNQLLKSKSFLSEYFLGSRSLGVWAFALTFAATSASGGSFTGFPAKIYTHGWILALWIGSYTVVPICTMGLLGKRLNQVARISGAITVPDVLRDRFNSRKFGLLAVSLIVFFMSFNLVAQFKAGSIILKVLLSDVDAFKSVAASFSGLTGDGSFFGNDSQYLVCLLFFGVAVIIYTTYGGFHAVVWTDVLQGIVMVIGVLILLPLAISAVGGLGNATKQMADMTPPRRGYATVEFAGELEKDSDGKAVAVEFNKDTWIKFEDGDATRVFRVANAFKVAAANSAVDDVQLLEITTPAEVDKILTGKLDIEFDEKLAVTKFSNANEKVGTLVAALESPAASSVTIAKGTWFKSVTRDGKEQHMVSVAEATVKSGESSAVVSIREPVNERLGAMSEYSVSKVSLKTVSYAFGADKKGGYVTGPAPDPNKIDGFLPLSIAISFFFMWAISGAGQPSNMVRLMAFKDTKTLQRSIFAVAIYYTAIYLPLVLIFCCARVLMPGMEAEPDRIMPQIAVALTENVGAGWLGGLLIAAPFAAVMSTVDSFLLMISSAVVRDIYQRNINPQATEKRIKQLSYLCTLLVGSAAMIVAINPPDFLQDIIVYVGSGLAACFLAPVVFGLYWPRSNETGCIAGMLAGFGAHLSMYIAGAFTNGSFFSPLRLFTVDPIIVGLVTSFVVTYFATLASAPPSEELVRKFFYRKKDEA
jgi:sodium/pantothenate symporter